MLLVQGQALSSEASEMLYALKGSMGGFFENTWTK